LLHSHRLQPILLRYRLMVLCGHLLLLSVFNSLLQEPARLIV
jgi:hypothetical protein